MYDQILQSDWDNKMKTPNIQTNLRGKTCQSTHTDINVLTETNKLNKGKN